MNTLLGIYIDTKKALGFLKLNQFKRSGFENTTYLIRNNLALFFDVPVKCVNYLTYYLY